MSWNLNDSLGMEKVEKMERSILVKGESEGSRRGTLEGFSDSYTIFAGFLFPRRNLISLSRAMCRIVIPVH